MILHRLRRKHGHYFVEIETVSAGGLDDKISQDPGQDKNGKDQKRRRRIW